MDVSVNADVDAFAAEVNVAPVAETGADVPTATSSNGQKFYTEEDLARVRSQEKDKLYPQINSLKEELDAIKRDRDAEAAEKTAREEAEAAAIAEEAKRKQEEELEVRDLLKVKEQEWSEQLERERQERERAFALLEREKAFTEIQNYRNSRLEEERDNIIPELVDMISGGSIEEIEQSIQGLKDRSSRILDSVQQATQTARRDMAGTRVTTPPAGPMDIETGSRQFSAADIADMPMNEYVKYRQQLLSPSAQGRSQGLFG
jgi:hypothetical protein